MLNPINHAATRAGVQRYKVEPYVSAADVYSVAPHVGRGGWTWYTGSAGWMYRAGVECILGLRVQADFLLIDPCIPAAWPEFGMTLRYRGAVYEIAVHNPEMSAAASSPSNSTALPGRFGWQGARKTLSGSRSPRDPGHPGGPPAWR